ncbi:hypothetical protein GCM10028784_27450 [Myceligenerans cantabricum]
MHVVVIAEGGDGADELAEAWRRAVPEATAEAHGVGVAPAAPAGPHGAGARSAAGGAGGSPGTDGLRAPDRPEPVVVAGARLGVGVPPPEQPGPSAPRSALPAGAAARLAGIVAAADVVAAHVAVLDAGSLRTGPVAEAAAAAAPHAVPVVALAGRVEVTRRELASAGISGAHEISGADVARVARSWTPGWA